MRKDITVAAEPRTKRGKNEARRLRASGAAPGVIYGSIGEGSIGEAVAVAIDPKDVNKILHSQSGHNTIFNLSIRDGENTPVMIVDWQRDPVKENLLHVDMKRIDLTVKLNVKIPVHTSGVPNGVKLQGGLLETITREIEIECLPDEIPEHFTVDTTELMIGQGIRAADVPLTGSMRLLSAADSVISHVVALKAEVVEAAATEGAPAATSEPEVIKKGKKDEEGAATDEKKKPEEKKKK